MKNKVPTFKEYLFEEKISNLNKYINESVVKTLVTIADSTKNYKDFETKSKKEILAMNDGEEKWKDVSTYLKDFFDSVQNIKIDESEILDDWMKPTSNLNHIMDANLNNYKTGKQNYIDFAPGTKIRCTNVELGCFGLEGSVISIESLLIRVDIEGIVYECYPEDLEIIE